MDKVVNLVKLGLGLLLLFLLQQLLLVLGLVLNQLGDQLTHVTNQLQGTKHLVKKNYSREKNPSNYFRAPNFNPF